MVGLLTWPVHGTWFARPVRGWVDRGGRHLDRGLPEPTRQGGAGRLRWPAVRLDDEQQALVVCDLERIAALRGFDLIMAVAAADHAHVLLAADPGRDIPRLVQLIKGSLSRTLTVAAGDGPAASTRGELLEHRKWWARQYSFVAVDDAQALRLVVGALEAHGGALRIGAKGGRAEEFLSTTPP